MTDHLIEIFVKGSPPKLSYSDDGTTEMRLGENVRWVCEKHDYDIRFAMDASPFEGSTIPSSSSSGTEKKYTEWCTATKEAKHRVKFKYTVSVKVDNGEQLVEDPIIIVDDEGST